MEGACYEWVKKADGDFWRKEVEGFLELYALILFLKTVEKMTSVKNVKAVLRLLKMALRIIQFELRCYLRPLWRGE